MRQVRSSRHCSRRPPGSLQRSSEAPSSFQSALPQDGASARPSSELLTSVSSARRGGRLSRALPYSKNLRDSVSGSHELSASATASSGFSKLILKFPRIINVSHQPTRVVFKNSERLFIYILYIVAIALTVAELAAGPPPPPRLHRHWHGKK